GLVRVRLVDHHADHRADQRGPARQGREPATAAAAALRPARPATRPGTAAVLPAERGDRAVHPGSVDHVADRDHRDPGKLNAELLTAAAGLPPPPGRVEADLP